jgi:hypothetical protein
MKLELKKFDPSTIKSDSVVVFIGKRTKLVPVYTQELDAHDLELFPTIIIIA